MIVVIFARDNSWRLLCPD